MPMWIGDIEVMLKPSVNDPQGQSIRGALRSLGFAQVESVRAGKVFQVHLSAANVEEARSAIDRMCEQLLANPVIEGYTFEVTLEPSAPEPAA